MSLVYSDGVPTVASLFGRAVAASTAREEALERVMNGENVPNLNQILADQLAAATALKQGHVDALNAAGQARRTHALIIGVGSYPHLPGGSLADGQGAIVTLGLSQLTTSLHSARVMTDWLLSRFTNPAAPLGSVELLLSPGVYTPSPEAAARIGIASGTDVAVEEATLDNIKEAFDGWIARCAKFPNDIALFFFSGHGVEKEVSLLLPSDFGKLTGAAGVHAQNRPFEQAIDLTTTHRLMSQCQVGTQCFFIDACRETPFQLLTSQEKPGVSLMGDLGASPLQRDAPLYQAAAEGMQAFGPPDGPTYFTTELIRCLEGLGAQGKRQGVWRITTGSLRSALVLAIERFRQVTGKQITCDGGNGKSSQITDLHFVQTSRVPVLTSVECQPDNAHCLAELYLRDDNAETVRTSPATTPWLLEVLSGVYEVGARFQTGAGFQNCAFPDQFAHPPIFEPELRA